MSGVSVGWEGASVGVEGTIPGRPGEREHLWSVNTGWDGTAPTSFSTCPVGSIPALHLRGLGLREWKPDHGPDWSKARLGLEPGPADFLAQAPPHHQCLEISCALTKAPCACSSIRRPTNTRSQMFGSMRGVPYSWLTVSSHTVVF